MIYFTMHQDDRILAAPNLTLTKKEVEELQQFPTPENLLISKIVYVKSKLMNKIDYPDFIEAPILLISEKLKSLMAKYQKNIWMRTIVLIDEKTNHQNIYYTIYPPRISCTSKQSVYDFSKLKEFILNEDRVGYNRIFVPEGLEQRLVVRLDVAESILRRKLNGIIFEEVKNETGADEE